MKKSLSLG